MRLFRGELLGRIGKGVFFALLALFLIAPRAAVAGCGNHARPSHTPYWQFGELLQGDLTTTDDPASDRPTPLPGCSGPSCSNNVPAPLSSGIRPVLDPHQGESLLTAASTSPPLTSRTFRSLDEPLAPTFTTSRVFHPPRSIA